MECWRRHDTKLFRHRFPRLCRVAIVKRTKSFSRGQSSRSSSLLILNNCPHLEAQDEPKTFSLCPAKSMVLTPRVCCTNAPKIGCMGEVRPTLVPPSAEMNVLRWIVGKVNWRVREFLNARLGIREAMTAVLLGNDKYCNEVIQRKYCELFLKSWAVRARKKFEILHKSTSCH